MSHPTRLDISLALLAGLVLACLGPACDRPAPESVDLKTEVDYLVSPDESGDAIKKRLIREIKNADDRVWGALAGDVVDSNMADALVAAHNNPEVDVQLVADADQQGTDGFQRLQDAGIPISWGDGQLSYLPDPNLTQVTSECRRRDDRRDVVCTASDTTSSPCDDESVSGGQGSICRPGDFNLMSHRFVIIDKRTVWNLAAGFDTGDLGNVAWRTESEYLREDFVREFRQMRGGVFATELDTFNGPVKSSTDAHVDYMTDEGVLAIRFNPQERLMKHVIDEVYRAKKSVRLTSASLTNPFLLDALEYKANNGFTVEIVVGEGNQPQGPARDRLVDLGAKVHSAGRALPSVVMIDGEEDKWPRTALVVSHPFWHGQPFEVTAPTDPEGEDASDRVRVYPSDHFVDGNLWTLREFASNTHDLPSINRIAGFVDQTVDQASEL